MQNKDPNREDPTNSSGVHGEEGTPVHVQLVIVKEAVLEGWEAALSLESWSDAVWSQINRIEWLRVKNIRIRSTHIDVRGSTVLDRSFDIVCCRDTNGGVTLDHAWPEPSIWLAFGRAWIVGKDRMIEQR